MKRVTLRIPERQIEEIEEQVDRGRFPNRSEAIRTAVRELLEEHDGPRSNSSPNGGYQERDPRNLRTDGGLTISLEELEKRKQSNSSTPPEDRNRCPTCGDANPVRKVERNNQSQKDGKYRCTRDDCYAHFDEPATGYATREAFLEDQEEGPELVTDGGQGLACPECDATEISHRNGRDGKATARTWHCHICRADFKEPNRRAPKTPGGTVSIPGGTGAAALAKMDPDDLVTDGGRDLSMELIEKAEEFDEFHDALLERGDDDARVAAEICDDVREICLRLADVLERRESVRERFRIDDDEVLTDGGVDSSAGGSYRWLKDTNYGCRDCDWPPGSGWGKNGLGLSAQHAQKTGHEVWVEEVWGHVFNDPNAGNKNTESDRQEAGAR